MLLPTTMSVSIVSFAFFCLGRKRECHARVWLRVSVCVESHSSTNALVRSGSKVSVEKGMTQCPH